MVSVSSQLPVEAEAEDTRELDTAEDVLRLTVRRGSTRRYSVVSAVSGRSLVMLDLPIIVVTGPHDQAEAAESGWDQGYKNFKFRLKKSLKEREAEAERRAERHRRGRDSIDTLTNAAERVQKMRLKQRRKQHSNMTKNRVK